MTNIKIKKRPAADIYRRKRILIYRNFTIFAFSVLFFYLSGCSGYKNTGLYSERIRTVYVEMFDNTTYFRDLEYTLTDAIAKRIEVDTPYKVVSDRAVADTVLSGKLTQQSSGALTLDRDTGRAIENQAEVSAQFSWKNLKTGQFLVKSARTTASMGYSAFQSQSFENASQIAANKLAERIVEQLQDEW